MIAFDLSCDQDHTFEAWFQDRQALETQQQEGLLLCPVCGSARVRKIPSAVAIRKVGGEDGTDFGDVVLQLLRRAYEVIEKHTEDVGPAFAKEALKIHYGAIEPRNIRGVATASEEKVLKDEGISFFRLPVPTKGPSEGH